MSDVRIDGPRGWRRRSEHLGQLACRRRLVADDGADAGHVHEGDAFGEQRVVVAAVMELQCRVMRAVDRPGDTRPRRHWIGGEHGASVGHRPAVEVGAHAEVERDTIVHLPPVLQEHCGPLSIRIGTISRPHLNSPDLPSRDKRPAPARESLRPEFGVQLQPGPSLHLVVAEEALDLPRHCRDGLELRWLPVLIHIAVGAQNAAVDDGRGVFTCAWSDGILAPEARVTAMPNFQERSGTERLCQADVPARIRLCDLVQSIQCNGRAGICPSRIRPVPLHVSFDPCVGRRCVRELHDCQERALRPRRPPGSRAAYLLAGSARRRRRTTGDHAGSAHRPAPSCPTTSESPAAPSSIRFDRSTASQSSEYSASAEKRLPPDRSTAFRSAPVDSPYSALPERGYRASGRPSRN